MDVVAARAGLAPDELRRRNFIVQGQMSAIGQVMREPVEMDALLDRALVLSDYHRKRETFDRANGHSPVKQGIGFATFCTAPVLRDRAKCTWPLSSPWKPRRTAMCACSPPARKSVRAPTRSLRRSSPTRWGSDTTRWRSRSLTPRTCPTVARRSPRARQWWSGKLVETAARTLKQTLVDAGLLGAGGTGDAFTARMPPSTSAHTVRCGP